MNVTPTKQRRRWPWGLLIVILGTGAALYALSLDDDPPDDADLLASNPALPEAENGYLELRRLHDEDDQAPGPKEIDAGNEWWGDRPFPRAVFAAQAAKNRAVLDEVRELARSRFFQLSVDDFGEGFLLVKGFARSLDHRARVRARQGQGAEALDDAFAALSLGLAMESRPASLVDWLVGLAIQGVALRSLEDVISQLDLDEACLFEVEERLAGLPDPRGLADALRGDYRHVRENLKEARALMLEKNAGALPGIFRLGYFEREDAARSASVLIGTPLEGLVYKPERTLALWAALVREQIAAVERGVDFRGFERGSWLEELASTNSIGQALVRRSITDQLAGCLDKRRSARLNRSLVRTLVALRRYAKREGRLPESLEDLTPRLLAAVPLDLDGQPVRYRQDLKIVYSIGADQKDDIAAGADPMGHQDVVFSLKRRP